MLRVVLFAVLIICFTGQVHCWGFYGHKRINRTAVFTLPMELMAFYKQHIEFITEHAVDADMRRYALEEEGARHYIDIDHYGEDPFNKVPRSWDEAVKKYSEDTLRAYGIVPWYVETMYHRLVYAFSKKDVSYILKASADIGHYIADAHVPLHTTENYNGQMTNQHGIHGFWESRLPELYADDYDYFTGQASFLLSPTDAIWDAVEQSHAAVDSVLTLERGLTQSFPADQKFSYDQRGNSTVKTYSRDFSAEYHTMLNGMVERRMRRSIIVIGSFWYSAWIEAGKPILTEAEQAELDAIEEERKVLEAQKHNGEILGREHED